MGQVVVLTGGFAKRVYCHAAEKRTEEGGAHRNGPPGVVAIAEALPKLPLEAGEGLEIARRVLPCKQLCRRLKLV